MRSEETPLGDVLARAMKNAGLVLGYKHMCRWCKKTRPHEEEHPDCEPRHCPQCERKLWPKAIKRTLRFHDLRHTTASLLLAAGVDLFAVQKILRHTDPKVTSEVYAHLVPGYLHGAVDKLVLTPPNDPEISRGVTRDPARFGAPVVRAPSKSTSLQSIAPKKIPNIGDLVRRAWQESNLRPAASKLGHLGVLQCPAVYQIVCLRPLTPTTSNKKGRVGTTNHAPLATTLPQSQQLRPARWADRFSGNRAPPRRRKGQTGRKQRKPVARFELLTFRCFPICFHLPR
jgi:hypothetical protein